MKMKSEHYEALKRAVDDVIRRKPEWRQAYINQGLSMTRYRWDVFHASGIAINSWREVYEYCNDDHIDTALRRAIP